MVARPTIEWRQKMGALPMMRPSHFSCERQTTSEAIKWQAKVRERTDKGYVFSNAILSGSQMPCPVQFVPCEMLAQPVGFIGRTALLVCGGKSVSDDVIET